MIGAVKLCCIEVNRYSLLPYPIVLNGNDLKATFASVMKIMPTSLSIDSIRHKNVSYRSDIQWLNSSDASNKFVCLEHDFYNGNNKSH